MTPLEKAMDKVSELLSKREDENEYHLHDVDRKWIIEVMMDYVEYCLHGKSLQTEISDEEIGEQAIKYDNQAFSETPIAHFIEGAKWYREQLKKK